MPRTCCRETLAQARDAIETMMVAQWVETGDSLLPLNPNWALYEQLDQFGKLLLLVVREDGRAMGYAAGFLHPHVNSRGTTVATIPTWYVERASGRVFIEKALLQEMTSRLFESGAQRVSVETNADHSAARLFEAMGFRPSKVSYSMAAGDAHQEVHSA